MQPFATPGNQPLGFNVPRKKIVPYGPQEDVVETFCRIRTGQLTSPEQIPATVQDNFRSAVEFVLGNVKVKGLHVFWQTYTIAASNNQLLRDWTELVEQEPRGKWYQPLAKAEATSASDDADTSEICETSLADVVPEKISWLWQKRIALGKLATLDGDPGLGKSSIALDLAARVSRGWNMPDGTPGVLGGVVIIMPEDGLSDTILPRLLCAGAQVSQCCSLGLVKFKDQKYDRPFLISEDLERLEGAIKRVQAKLVIIDPLMAIVGNKDPYRDNEARAMLAPLVSMMERYGCACLMIRHLTKGGGEHILYRGGGSIGIIAQARTALAVAHDPNDEKRNVLALIKSNIGKYPPAFTFTIESEGSGDDARSYVAWGEAIDLSPRDLGAPPTATKPNTLRQDILRVLQEHHPEEMSVQAVAEAFPEVLVNTINVTLRRMVEDGLIEKSAKRGLYAALSGK